MGRIFRITTRLDDQPNSFKGQTFLQDANKTTIFKLVECCFFFAIGEPDVNIFADGLKVEGYRIFFDA